MIKQLIFILFISVGVLFGCESSKKPVDQSTRRN